MRVVVEEMVTKIDDYGQPFGIAWKTDCVTSRYWAGRRWGELAQQDRTPRLMRTDGTPLPFGE